MTQPRLLIVETDILVRHPLAEYLRECGYLVLEATDADEARQIIESESEVEIVLADADAPGGSGFAFASWLRREHPKINVVLAGNVAVATEKAGGLCEDGPNLAKPYDHRMVLNYIQRLLATRGPGR
jgi:DNA-binding response OmpR family regulator